MQNAGELRDRLLGETKLKTLTDSVTKIRLLDTPAEEGLKEVILISWFKVKLITLNLV